MKYVCLILAHVVLYHIFEFDFFSIFMVLVLIIDDIFVIKRLNKYLKNKEYKSILNSKTKKYAMIFNVISIAIITMLIYLEYISPESRTVAEEFRNCKEYETDLFYTERFMNIIPSSVKRPIIVASRVQDNLKEYSERLDNANEDEQQVIKLELKAYAEEEKVTLEGIKNDIHSRIVLLYCFMFSMIAYLFLWNLDKIILLADKLRNHNGG